MTEEVEVTFSIYNRTDTKQSFSGEVTDDKGNLILSGDWDLKLQGVREGKVVSTKELRPQKRPEAEVIELEPRGHGDWKAKMALKQLVSGSGNYRFLLSLGEHTRQPGVFSVLKKNLEPQNGSL